MASEGFIPDAIKRKRKRKLWHRARLIQIISLCAENDALWQSFLKHVPCPSIFKLYWHEQKKRNFKEKTRDI